MINCNPETVSTDYDTSDRLYFEPLTLRGRARGLESEQPRGRDRAVRRPDAAAARRGPRSGGRAAARHRASTRSTSPRIAAASARCCAASASGAALRDRALGRGGARGRRARSASRCSCGRATCSAGARWRSSTRPRTSRTTCDAAREADQDGTRDAASTASSRTRSRSTWTRSATATRRLDRRDHAARRGGRHPFRRLGLRAAAALARRRDAGARSASRRAGSRWSSASSGC